MTIDEATLEFAHRLADAAGEVIRPYFRQRVEVIDKGKEAFDPVTAADRGAEEALRAIIRRERPDDAILGEEYGHTPGSSGRTWVLDPVDGTRAFITGRHTWGTLIALEENGRRVLGIIDQPVLRERYIGYDGASRHITPESTQALKTRACVSLAQAIVSTTHPWGYFTDAQRDAFERMARASRMSYFGGDCYAYALLAMGYIDLIAESSLKAWDVAALIPVIENAGGIATDWNGNPVAPDGGHLIAAGDPRVHAEAVKMLKGLD
ncbi:MAG TPA: histidinol-phosphatase [Rhizomicrobium sp.]|nr:histidinol-phosphatase [Rhizomicrobium sp.]